MTEKEILQIFEKTKAVLKGHFKLSSGLHSGGYLQCARALQYPAHAEKLCKALAGRFKSEKPDCVVAPALGGIVVSCGVGRALGVKNVFTERVEGKMTLRRGFELQPGERVLVVEDVVTTGLSTKEVVEVVRSFGAKVIAVGALVNRAKTLPEFGCRFESLITLDIPTFDPVSCPLCKSDLPITKPGSRT